MSVLLLSGSWPAVYPSVSKVTSAHQTVRKALQPGMFKVTFR